MYVFQDVSRICSDRAEESFGSDIKLPQIRFTMQPENYRNKHKKRYFIFNEKKYISHWLEKFVNLILAEQTVKFLS